MRRASVKMPAGTIVALNPFLLLYLPFSTEGPTLHKSSYEANPLSSLLEGVLVLVLSRVRELSAGYCILAHLYSIFGSLVPSILLIREDSRNKLRLYHS